MKEMNAERIYNVISLKLENYTWNTQLHTKQDMTESVRPLKEQLANHKA